MNVSGNSENSKMTNVVPLFSTVQVEIPDPLTELLKEAEREAWEVPEDTETKFENRILVSTEQFPDQSIYVLEQQLAALKESMARLKFYLTDIDDLLPR